MSEKVFVCAAGSYEPEICEAAVEKLFAALPVCDKIDGSTKLLLKPNLLARATPEKAVTTHPEILRAVIHACLRRGAKKENITVADSSGGVYNPAQMKLMYQITGLWNVCQEEGVCAYTDCESVTVPISHGKVVREFELLKPVVEADFIINLPRLKTHVMTGLTAATKNLFGTIPGLKKAEWHMRFPDKDQFGNMLIDLLLTVKPTIAVLDGIVGMEGNGPNGGMPKHLGLLMAGQDMLNLDLAAAELIGLDAMRVPYLKAANERGLCAQKFYFSDLALEPECFIAVLPTLWVLPESYLSSDSRGNTDFAATVPNFLKPLVRSIENKLAPHPYINTAKCVGCGKCAEICPQHTITMVNKKSNINSKNCIRCFCCHEMCPVKAIEVKQLKIFNH